MTPMLPPPLLHGEENVHVLFLKPSTVALSWEHRGGIGGFVDFKDRVLALASKVSKQADSLLTEEATKNALVMPFISSVFGYDVFDPLEVIPEFTADVGIKKNEKIDYAIMQDGEVQMLIECKASKAAPTVENASQLFRYFATTNARIAALTNGTEWHFFSDLDAPNRMDSKPFLVFDLKDIDETLLPELEKLSKAHFDLESIVSAAEELKYVGALKREIASQFRAPSDEWIKFFTQIVYEGSYTARIKEKFAELVPKASNQFLNERVNARLKSALGSSDLESSDVPTVTSQEVAEKSTLEADDIETTLEEIEGYHIVKAIACGATKATRITQRDAKSYFAVLLDDNNRKPIARLHFNAKTKYLGLLDADKVETRHPIESLDEIYSHAEGILEAVRRYS